MIRFTRKDDEIIQIFRNTYNARYLRGLEGDERTKSKKIEKNKRRLKSSSKSIDF